MDLFSDRAGDGCPKLVVPLKLESEEWRIPELPLRDDGVLPPVGGLGVLAPLFGFGEPEAEFDKCDGNRGTLVAPGC